MRRRRRGRLFGALRFVTLFMWLYRYFTRKNVVCFSARVFLLAKRRERCYNRNMYEILAPAGNKECALAAINSGADAVYLGYSAFSARAGAENFDFSELKEIIEFAHLFGVKIYVTMNTLVKESEIDEFLSALVSVHNLGADAVLLQDIFLGKKIHEVYPDITLHLSTQAGVNNKYGALLAKEYGFSRVVLARETALKEIKAVVKIIETEVFVQGALCTCFSGQCYFSSFVGNNSGNRGRCKQPCRKKYSYDTGDKRQNYALSLSDLCVGEDVAALREAGVVSFKIEGRMRRPEYVAAAVRYYKKIFTGQPAEYELSALKRTYNRGNYTKGLAFGQDKRFLSKSVQGHIGEKVGVVKVINGKYYVESVEKFVAGDGFKILRGGEEVGGGTFAFADKRGFYLSSRAKLKNGDGVFITTDVALNEKLLACKRKLNLTVTVQSKENRLVACGAGVTLISEFVLQAAKSAPMSENDVINCFLKTDEYPFMVRVKEANVANGTFVAKSQLNAFRRAFYAAVYQKLTENKNTIYEYAREVSLHFAENFENKKKNARTEKGGALLAVIGENFENIRADIYVFKPSSYANADAYRFEIPVPGECFLYLPAFMSEDDLSMVEQNITAFDGVYAEGSYGIVCAKKWGKKLFAGTGFNLSNACAVAEDDFDYYAISKELDETEQRELATNKSFVLSVGALKIMDIIYCPFEKKCAVCEKRNRYTLTDEGGRTFSLRRYKSSGNGCRFELYNCAYLVAPQVFSNTLIDLSVLPMPVSKEMSENYKNQEKLKEILPVCTAGHSKKSVL